MDVVFTKKKGMILMRKTKLTAMVLIFVMAAAMTGIMPFLAEGAAEGPVVYVNGNALGVPSLLVNDRTMVPFRAIFEALGFEVAWDAGLNLAYDGQMPEDLSGLRDDAAINVAVNGKIVIADVDPILVNDSTYVAVRFISEQAGLPVEWDEWNYAVYIGTPPRINDDRSQEVTIKWCIPSSGEPKGWKEVETEINKILKEKINARLEMKFIQWGDYETKMQMMMASMEEYDLCFTSTWINYTAPNISNGAYLSIDDLLQYTPRLKSLFTNGMWEASKFGGRIYGVPSLQVMYDQKGWWFKRSESEKYGFDIYGVKSFDDMSDIFAVIKENEPDLICAREGVPGLFTPLCTGFDDMLYIKNGEVLDYVDMYKDDLPVMRDWYLKGYFPADAATLQDDQPLRKAGKIYSMYGRYVPGKEAANRVSYDYDIYQIATTEPLISGDSVKSALTALSVTSRNPIRALKLVELMNTDKDLFNLMASGLEGRDYTRDPYNGNKKAEKLTEYFIPAFLFGNSFLELISPGYPDDIHEQTIAANEWAPLDPNTGFSFDTSKVESEMAQLSAVYLEYERIIKCGLEDTDTLIPRFSYKFAIAGYDKVKYELQSQYDAWKAGR